MAIERHDRRDRDGRHVSDNHLPDVENLSGVRDSETPNGNLDAGTTHRITGSRRGAVFVWTDAVTEPGRGGRVHDLASELCVQHSAGRATQAQFPGQSVVLSGW